MDDEAVGSVLARLRRAKRLTGGQLGKLVGMSQPKISRLENGVGFPDPEDVGRVARALGADEALVLSLMELAERSHNRMTDWRPFPLALANRQRTVGGWESDVRTFRVFQPAVIVGLLQTSEYARAVLTSFQRMITPDADMSVGTAVPEAVSARMQRQEVLADKNRTFHFVMAETVLENRICPPEDMPAQIRRLRDVAAQSNVSVGIIPADVEWSIPPFHGFLLLDDSVVMIDLFNTGITTKGRADARIYRQVFDSYERLAETNIRPILDRHLKRYLDLAQP